MQARKKLIVANWKMHGSAEMARAWLPSVSSAAQKFAAAADVVVCPPATLLKECAGTKVALGSQNCHTAPEGAFTGEISADMLKEAGCSYVIVGHSERRAQCAESSTLVSQKAASAIAAGLIPIICIGETLEQRDAGTANEVVALQLRESIPAHAAKTHFVLAYEPVWAIGSGRTPSSGDIESMHAHIAKLAPVGTKLLYGGSVKAANAREILTIAGVSGVLVGGASLKPEEFAKIIEAAA